MSLSKLFKIPYIVLLYFKLKRHGVNYGKHIRGNRPIIKNRGKITIGNRVSLNSFPAGELYKTGLLCHLQESVISIGNNCHLNGAIIHCRTSVTIGNYCLCGPGSSIIDNDSHRVVRDPLDRRKAPNSAPVVIEDNVWIGMNSLVLKGVTIGKNSIVAACSVVTKDVPENVIVAGNPARIVKDITN